MAKCLLSLLEEERRIIKHIEETDFEVRFLKSKLSQTEVDEAIENYRFCISFIEGKLVGYKTSLYDVREDISKYFKEEITEFLKKREEGHGGFQRDDQEWD